MKTLLNTIKHAALAVGETLKAAWYLLRQKVASALLALASKTTRQKAAVQTAAALFWRRHQSQIAWSTLTAGLTFGLTIALVIVGYRVPAVERWFTALLRGTLRLPSGYALRLLRPTPSTPFAPPLPPTPVSNNSPQPERAAA
jgi:hypothetical protein